MSLLQEKAPACIKRAGIEVFSGRIIACDASMVKKISIALFKISGDVSISCDDPRIHKQCPDWVDW